MRLEKWYADVVGDGLVSIHNRATLSLGPLRIAYRGELGRDLFRRGTFGICRSFPRLERASGAARLRMMTDAGPLTWRNATSRPMCLWTDGRRHVTWDPCVLNGAVEGALQGRGYAERLVMTVAPWRLAIDRLWWGRFCGERHSFVWIVWEGPHPLRVSLFDGNPLQLDEVGEDAMSAAALRLVTGERQLVVDQTLGAGDLAGLRLAKRIAPVSFLSGRERKWLAQGELQRGGRSIDQGKVICERVDWS